MNSKKEILCKTNFSLFSKLNGFQQLNQQMSWQETLEQTQNTIFCKEIFNQVNLYQTFFCNFLRIQINSIFIAFKRSF